MRSQVLSSANNNNNNSKNYDIRFLPSPGIKQTVGFCKFDLVDAARKEQFNKKKNRQFEVLVWYPGMNIKGTRKEYLEGHDISKLFFLKYKFWKEKIASVVGSIKTNSLVDIPVSNQRQTYPVIFFSHDIGMLPEYYTSLLEHLASEGYFVFSINHPYVAEASKNNSESGRKNIVTVKKLTALLSAFLLFKARTSLRGKSYEEKWNISKRLLPEWKDLADINMEMTADKDFLLQFLEQLNSTFYNKNLPYNIFSKHLDLTQIGVIGHGWGGSSAVHFLNREASVKAAVNLDGFQFGKVENATINKPLLVIYSEKYSEINEGIYFSASDLHRHTIKNSDHFGFTDWPNLFSDNKRGIHAFYETLNLVVNFFDKHLKSVNHLSFLKANNK
jgi:dienelactone hydrolase